MVGAILLWGSSTTAGKLVLDTVSVPEIVAFRILGGAVVLWTGGLLLRQKFRLSSPVPIIMGILEPGLVTFFIVLGLYYTSAVNAAVVWGIMPLTQPILARLFLKEPIKPVIVVGAVLAIGGTALLFYAKHQAGTGNLLGDFYLVVGVLCACANQMLARRMATTHRAPIVTTAYQLLSASVLALIFLFSVTAPAEAYQDIDGFHYGLLWYLVLCTAGPFFLYNFALQYMSVGHVSLFAPLSGPIGVLLAAIVFNEPADWVIVSAIVLAMVGAFIPTMAAVWTGRRA